MYWSIIIAAYTLMLVAVSVSLFELEIGPFTSQHKRPSALIAELSEPSQFTEVLAREADYSQALLPLGPEDGRLPGPSEIWSEFFNSERGQTAQTDANDFDGIQVATRIEDFYEGSIAEIFLSGQPSQGFRRGDFIISLNSSGVVHIIDCTKPHQPKLSGMLPYKRVKYMQMLGNFAFLLIDLGINLKTHLIVTDLSKPLKPRLISQSDLAEHVTSFFISDRQLITYVNTKGLKKSLSIHLYDLTEDFKLVPLGQGNAPEIGPFVQFGNYLLAAGSRAGLHVIDFSDPLQPAVIAKIDLPDVVKNIVRNGERVYALGEKQRLYVVDLHDPEHPIVSDVLEEANHSAMFLAFAEHIFLLTKNGYLRVFDRPAENLSSARSGQPAGLSGELVPNQSAGGFTLLSETQSSLPAAVTVIKSLPQETKVLDTLFWRGFLVVLGDDGLLQFFRENHEDSLELRADLKLPFAQRWLAASGQRLYVGGKLNIDVIAINDVENFAVTGHVEFQGHESWDGLIVDKTLCIAAGQRGVLCFSSEDPDRLEERAGWNLPEHLESQVDVRLLASPGDNRVFAAAGPVGVVGGRIDEAGQFQIDGLIDFPEPIQTLAVVEDFCLVSTGIGVEVIDIHHIGSLQNLGDIAFPGVTRFAVAQSDVWAGYVPGAGWSVSRVPYLVTPEDIKRMRLAARTVVEPNSMSSDYRLKLFNDFNVINVPGIVSFSPSSAGMAFGGSRGLQ